MASALNPSDRYAAHATLTHSVYTTVFFEQDEQTGCLQTLREQAAMGKLPKAMYTVPSGHNPTG